MEEFLMMEPNIEDLKRWKEEYKKLFKTTLTDGTIIIWRRLKRSEYRNLMRDFYEVDDRDERIWNREEAVCKTCILFPSQEEVADILECQAGIASIVSDDIFANSGFSVKEESEEVEL
jgi:hypothetical protein